MAKISLSELREKFGPAKNVAPYGSCIIVQGDLFDPDWEAYLAEERARCYFGELDSHPVVFVVPRKQLPSGKVEYVPPVPVVKPAAAKPVKNTVPASRNIAKRGPEWSDEAMAELLFQFDALDAAGKGYGASAVLAKLPQFMGRSETSVEVKLKRLKKLCKDGELPASVQAILASRKAADYSHGMEKMSENKGRTTKNWSLEDELLLFSLLRDTKKYGRNLIVEKAITVGKFVGRNVEGCLQHYAKIADDPVLLEAWKAKMAEEPKPQTSAPAEASAAVVVVADDSSKPTVAVEAAIAPKPGDAKYASFEEMWRVAAESKLSLKERAELFYKTASAVGLDGNILGSVVCCFQTLHDEQCLIAEQIDTINHLLPEFLDIFKLSNKLLTSHKHAQGSGEAVLPMEDV